MNFHAANIWENEQSVLHFLLVANNEFQISFFGTKKDIALFLWPKDIEFQNWLMFGKI